MDLRLLNSSPGLGERMIIELLVIDILCRAHLHLMDFVLNMVTVEDEGYNQRRDAELKDFFYFNKLLNPSMNDLSTAVMEHSPQGQEEEEGNILAQDARTPSPSPPSSPRRRSPPQRKGASIKRVPLPSTHKIKKKWRPRAATSTSSTTQRITPKQPELRRRSSHVPFTSSLDLDSDSPPFHRTCSRLRRSRRHNPCGPNLEDDDCLLRMNFSNLHSQFNPVETPPKYARRDETLCTLEGLLNLPSYLRTDNFGIVPNPSWAHGHIFPPSTVSPFLYLARVMSRHPLLSPLREEVEEILSNMDLNELAQIESRMHVKSRDSLVPQIHSLEELEIPNQTGTPEFDDLSHPSELEDTSYFQEIDNFKIEDFVNFDMDYSIIDSSLTELEKIVVDLNKSFEKSFAESTTSLLIQKSMDRVREIQSSIKFKMSEEDMGMEKEEGEEKVDEEVREETKGLEMEDFPVPNYAHFLDKLRMPKDHQGRLDHVNLERRKLVGKPFSANDAQDLLTEFGDRVNRNDLQHSMSMPRLQNRKSYSGMPLTRAKPFLGSRPPPSISSSSVKASEFEVSHHPSAKVSKDGSLPPTQEPKPVLRDASFVPNPKNIVSYSFVINKPCLPFHSNSNSIKSTKSKSSKSSKTPISSPRMVSKIPKKVPAKDKSKIGKPVSKGNKDEKSDTILKKKSLKRKVPKSDSAVPSKEIKKKGAKKSLKSSKSVGTSSKKKVGGESQVKKTLMALSSRSASLESRNTLMKQILPSIWAPKPKVLKQKSTCPSITPSGKATRSSSRTSQKENLRPKAMSCCSSERIRCKGVPTIKKVPGKDVQEKARGLLTPIPEKLKVSKIDSKVAKKSQAKPKRKFVKSLNPNLDILTSLFNVYDLPYFKSNANSTSITKSKKSTRN